jgi:hypothetical protein
MMGGHRDSCQASFAIGACAVLIQTFALITPAAVGLVVLPVGAVTVPLLGLAGLLAVAIFILLVCRCAAQAETLARISAAARVAANAEALAKAEASAEGWADGLDRRVCGLCAATFALMGALCGGLALASWLSQGPGAVLGLGTAAAAFLLSALAAGREALRR